MAQPADNHILITFADAGVGSATRPGPVRPGYVRRGGSYLVSVDVRRAARRIERRFDLERLDEWPIDPLRIHCIVYAIPDSADVETLLTELRAQPRVESAQRLNTFEVQSQDSAPDPFSNLQHNMDSLEVAGAHRMSRGEGSQVAIIDTGADESHPELHAGIREQRNFVDSEGQGPNQDAHGTAVAGIIGAATGNGIGIVGVAPSAALSVLKACWYERPDRAALCTSFTLAKALSFAIESEIRIINLSLGGPADPLLERLVQEAIARGKVVVAAASEGKHPFPSNVEGVISVGSVEASPAATRPRGILAPGTDILVPVPGGGFDYASGSSLSAAHVSGIVALLISIRPELSRNAVEQLLTADSARPGQSISACRVLAQLLDEAGCPSAQLAKGSR